ncbi:hypothetical protein, partial [Streptomyces turgidiscabies]|uniref:hypothetical protein n=1 Tax=Streptomyces turgidiscabies TaxID=85558 RepID=UPI0038F73223
VQTARAYQDYSTKTSVEDLAAMLRSQTHHHHPAGADLKQEIAAYVNDLKTVSVFKPSTDAAKFADRFYGDVLS